MVLQRGADAALERLLNLPAIQQIEGIPEPEQLNQPPTPLKIPRAPRSTGLVQGFMTLAPTRVSSRSTGLVQGFAGQPETTIRTIPEEASPEEGLEFYEDIEGTRQLFVLRPDKTITLGS